MDSTEAMAIWQDLLSKRPGAQRRFERHPLRLHYGTDELGRPILLLRLDNQPEPPELGSAVSVEVGERAGYGEWTMVFTLHEPALTGTFLDLCIDLAGRSSLADDEGSALRLFQRALQDFKDLLLGGLRGPSLERLRGLVGELWYAVRVMLPKLGAQAAVMAWTGPLGAVHDFRDTDDGLFEVKSIHAEARVITISSVEQLDPREPSPLTLVTVMLEERQRGARDSLTVGSLITEFKEALVEYPGSVRELNRRLEALGLAQPDPAIERSFAVVGSNHYRVGPGFPRLLRHHTPPEIEKVTYRLRLSTLEEFLWEDHQIPEVG